MSNNISIELSELLKKYDVKYVNDFTEIENLLDFEKLEDNGEHKILTDRNSVLIFDLPVFNNTYVIDLVNKYFDEKLQKELDEIIDEIEDDNTDDIEIPDDDIEIDLYYIDDIKILKKIFPDMKKKIIEEDYDTYPIGFITINPKKVDVRFWPEHPIAGITDDYIKFIFETYNNNE
jgi:hypothetical protein